MNVFFVDNFDSFSFNLVDELRKLGATVDVWRNDISAEQAVALVEALAKKRMILFSPGPGRPEEAGCCEKLIQLAAGRIPIFGVCLGLQAMVQAYGGKVGSAGQVVHGKSDGVTHNGQGIFSGLPSPLQVGRYHSLVASHVPDDFEVTAWSGSLVMAVAHRSHPVAGVQFHPESILTPRGAALLKQMLVWAGQFEER